ncbi:hypothetical protein [Stenotrophomonas riyadhensis]|uniref:hypothetical protein n=1 Tax=Stenotrophomonas riyadhensis TaxID=2859893 RepID=UPI0033057D06
MIFSLPADAAGTQGVIAIRAFMQPGSAAGPASGGIHVAPTLAPQPESRELYRVRIARNGPMRGMALIVMLMITVSQYTSELGSLGFPTIWFPFGIGVTLTQYVYGIAIPLLAVLIVRSATTAAPVSGARPC